MLVQHNFTYAVLRLFQRITDENALAERQSVCLQHDRELRCLQVSQRLVRVVKVLIGRCGNSVFFHQILGEGLGALQDSRVFPGAKDAQPLFFKHIHDSAHQRIVHAYYRQIDLFFLCERCQLLKFHGANGHAFRIFFDARVSRRAVYLFCLRTLGNLPRNGMFPSAGTYD